MDTPGVPSSRDEAAGFEDRQMEAEGREGGEESPRGGPQMDARVRGRGEEDLETARVQEACGSRPQTR